MKALILNLGLGSRMGGITVNRPKCLVNLDEEETILGRQLKLIKDVGIKEVVITTRIYENDIRKYCNNLGLDLKYTFVNNSLSNKTNYIYSIYLAKEFLDDSIVLMHGDLVFDYQVLNDLMNCKESVIAVSTTNELLEKDFKAVLKEESIEKIGVEFFENAIECQPLYKLNKQEWIMWLQNICLFCENNNVKCYAENAFNDISYKCIIHPMDFKKLLCSELDTVEDLQRIKKKL